MKHILTATAIATLIGAPLARAEELPRHVRQDHRVREVEYDPSQVVLVATQRLFSTQVEFSAD
jgi:type IV secretory pathway VirB9-like protein